MVSQEDWRVQNFTAKFKSAATELNASSYSEIEALKFKDTTNSHYYRELIKELSSLNISEIQGNYQGRAWKITDNNHNSVIIVEHETGLEILYIAGAVASIVSLIPIVINIWNRIRDHWPPFRGHSGIEGIEIRRFDRKNKLIEEPAPPVETIILQHLLRQNEKLGERISFLETEVSKLKTRLDNQPNNSDKGQRTNNPGKKTKP